MSEAIQVNPPDTDVLGTVGDFEIRRCCSEGHLFLLRGSSVEGTEVPAQEVSAMLALDAQYWEPQLARCFDRHF